MQILEFLMQSFLLDFAISDGLIKHILVLLSEVGQLCCLLGFQGVESSLHSFLPFVNPVLLLFSLHLEDLLLNFVSLGEAE